MVHTSDRRIVCTHTGSGKTHDLELLKKSKVKIHPRVVANLDRGYKGFEHQHPVVLMPKKEYKHQPLSAFDKAFNRMKSSGRILIEHIIRNLKIFRILSERYRNRRNRFELRINLISAIYNYELQ